MDRMIFDVLELRERMVCKEGMFDFYLEVSFIDPQDLLRTSAETTLRELIAGGGW